MSRCLRGDGLDRCCCSAARARSAPARSARLRLDSWQKVRHRSGRSFRSVRRRSETEPVLVEWRGSEFPPRAAASAHHGARSAVHAGPRNYSCSRRQYWPEIWPANNETGNDSTCPHLQSGVRATCCSAGAEGIFCGCPAQCAQAKLADRIARVVSAARVQLALRSNATAVVKARRTAGTRTGPPGSRCKTAALAMVWSTRGDEQVRRTEQDADRVLQRAGRNARALACSVVRRGASVCDGGRTQS